MIYHSGNHHSLSIKIVIYREATGGKAFSALVEAEGYCKKTRLEEIMDFANRCGYKKLGLAFCMGLKKEANILTKILKENSFEVESVIGKNGAVPKEFLNVSKEHKVKPDRFEPMCDPKTEKIKNLFVYGEISSAATFTARLILAALITENLMRAAFVSDLFSALYHI